jgi:hypothetical protein
VQQPDARQHDLQDIEEQIKYHLENPIITIIELQREEKIEFSKEERAEIEKQRWSNKPPKKICNVASSMKETICQIPDAVSDPIKACKKARKKISDLCLNKLIKIDPASAEKLTNLLREDDLQQGKPVFTSGPKDFTSMLDVVVEYLWEKRTHKAQIRYTSFRS